MTTVRRRVPAERTRGARPRAERARRHRLQATLAAGAAVVVVPLAAAWRFGVVYRRRAGFPARHEALATPADVGLPCEDVRIAAPSGSLPGWFIPAAGGPGPGVVVVHGWESGRDRALPHAAFLHAAGFHCLVFDVRGHGANPPEELPITAAEFGEDTVAAARALLSRPEVTRLGIVGHSMGGVGAILAAAVLDGDCGGLVSVSAPADPRRLTRETFRMAHLPIPSPVAVPLAWMTARLFVRPRGHSVGDVSASRAIAAYPGPVLVVHGTDDPIVPVDHARRLVRAARRTRGPGAEPVELLLVEGGRHSWLYEDAGYRRTIGAFLAKALGGPTTAATAGDRAAAAIVTRPPESASEGFSAAASPAPGKSAPGRAAPGRSVP